MSKLIFLQKAREDLDEIHMYISQDSIVNANNMINKILDATKQLKDFPLMGISVSAKIDIKGDYRMLSTKPYLVFYRAIDDTVYIYRVLHGRRYYGALLEE